MKLRLSTILVLIFSLITSLVLVGQEIDEKKLERKLKKLEERLKDKSLQLHSIEIPEIHLDLSGLEESMVQLEHSLSHLEHIEIPEIHVEIPQIDIEIPASIRAGIAMAKLLGRQRALEREKKVNAKDSYLYISDIARHVLLGSLKPKPGMKVEDIVDSIIARTLGG